MTTAMFSIIGIAIGASLQYIFSKYLDSLKHRRELRSQAYADYLQCVSEYANLGSGNEPQEVANLAMRTADAKCRICLYGSAGLIRAFSQFEQLGAAMNTKEQRDAFTALVSRMREDSGMNQQPSLEELQSVLLGTKPSDD